MTPYIDSLAGVGDVPPGIQQGNFTGGGGLPPPPMEGAAVPLGTLAGSNYPSDTKPQYDPQPDVSGRDANGDGIDDMSQQVTGMQKFGSFLSKNAFPLTMIATMMALSGGKKKGGGAMMAMTLPMIYDMYKRGMAGDQQPQQTQFAQSPTPPPVPQMQPPVT